MLYHNLDPVLLNIGPISIKWYGISYIIGFIFAWLIGRARIKLVDNWQGSYVTDLIFFGAWGVIIGGRLGYWLFYGLDRILHDPLEVFKVWHGGMSFHGGLIGVMIALALFSRKYKLSFIEVIDFAAVMTPPALFFGRIGNFISGELYGRPTNVPWAVIFPHSDGLPRHPSQLYEAFGEGLILFCILWFYGNKKRNPGELSALFLFCYGTIRFTIEHFREPDHHIGFVLFDWITQGQLLSAPMILIGIIVLLWIKFFQREVKV